MDLQQIKTFLDEGIKGMTNDECPRVD